MNALKRLSLSNRIVLFAGSILVAVTLLLTVTVIVTKTANYRSELLQSLSRAVLVLSQDLASEFPELTETPARGDAVATLVREPGALVIPAAFMDRVGQITDSRVTYFDRNPTTGEFERVMTNVQNAGGARAVRTILDPAGPAKAALVLGRTFAGEVDILGTRHMTIYEPVFDASGNVVGATFAGVGTGHIGAKIAEFILYLAIPAFGIMIAGLVILRSLVRRAVGPVTELVDVIGSLEKRDYSVDIPIPVTEDEVAALTRACISLRDDLLDGQRQAERVASQDAEREQVRAELARVIKDLSEGLTRIADGDLTVEIDSPADRPFPQDYESLRRSYNGAIQRFSQVIAEVTQIAQGVRDSSAEIAEASRELSGRTETQAATLEQSAAALTELTQSVASTAERAGAAQEASFGNRTEAERGAEIVRDAVTAMQGIEQGSEQITRIIGVIDDIAFQTNLLALNAGVEAARAGEAGRGFAVVASEVRLLAQRASDSAREIKTLISDSTQQVDKGSALVRKAGDSLAEILGRANEAASLVADIALAAAEQARGLTEVNSGVNQLDNVTQQNSAVAEETSASAATLQTRSEQLINVLAGFRINQGGTGRSSATARVRADIGGGAAIEARVANWAPAAAAAANTPRASKAKSNGAWTEF